MTDTSPEPVPPCAFCKDDLAESIRSLLDGEHYVCDDRAACTARQARQVAEKAATP